VGLILEVRTQGTELPIGEISVATRASQPLSGLERCKYVF
jgi:hypothetical protein